MFSRDFISKRDDSLDISWLKDESLQDSETLPEPEVLAKAAMTDLEGALADLNEIVALLEAEAE
jgi:type I restriction enzyme M protein